MKVFPTASAGEVRDRCSGEDFMNAVPVELLLQNLLLGEEILPPRREIFPHLTGGAES